MAASLSNHSLLAPSLSPVSVSSLSKTPFAINFLHRPTPPLLCKPLTGFPPFNCSHVTRQNYSRRRCFKARLSPEDSVSTAGSKGENHQNDVKAPEHEATRRQLPSLKNLIKIYREALFYGDMKTLSDIEATIGVIENEQSELVQQVASLSAEITSGKEKYIRLQADFDNFRKRSEKEKLNIRNDAQGEVIEGLLPMVDSFERAKQQLKPETEKEKKIDASYQGIYKQFVEIMKSLQVTAVPTVGKPFDPSLHEAIAREDSSEYKEGIIIQEFRRGFLLGNRLIRPAMVKVSSGLGIKKAHVDAEQPATAGGVDER